MCKICQGWLFNKTAFTRYRNNLKTVTNSVTNGKKIWRKKTRCYLPSPQEIDIKEMDLHFKNRSASLYKRVERCSVFIVFECPQWVCIEEFLGRICKIYSSLWFDQNPGFLLLGFYWNHQIYVLLFCPKSLNLSEWKTSSWKTTSEHNLSAMWLCLD